MRNYFLSLSAVCFLMNIAFAQKTYFQQKVDVTIDVTLNDTSHKLSGNCIIDYHNNSEERLDTLYFHLWANAYKDQTTAFAKQQLKNRSLKYHFADEESHGNFESISFQSEGELSFEYVDNNPDIVAVKLNRPILPGEMQSIKIPFTLKIPASFSRLGHVGTSYQITQWYPKPAVYDKDGWHPMPYLNMGEFYSEFGDFDVTLTLPANYVVGATGVLTTASEVAFLNKKIEWSKAVLDTITTKNLDFPESDTEYKTINYKASNVHDFGWFADKRFYVEKSAVKLSNGREVDTYVFYTDVERDLWSEGINYVNRAVQFYSENVGDYPYPQATALQSALSAGGGMEYPMITVIGSMGSPKSLDAVITHEVGHNWFYGILGFNERDYPWLDEGINSYYDHRYLALYYPKSDSGGLPKFISKDLDQDLNSTIVLLTARIGEDQPVNIHSAAFKDFARYFVGAYEKPAVAFAYLEHYLGTAEYDRIMQTFFQKWSFRHPGPQDLRNHFETETEQNLDWFFDDLIGSTKTMDYKIQRLQASEDYNVSIKNKGKINSPVILSAIKDSQIIEQKIIDGFDGSRIVTLPKADYDRIVIDPEFKSLDAYRFNNSIKTTGSFKKSKAFGLRFLTGGDNSRKNYINYLPLIGGNSTDGFMLGMNFNNISIPNRRFEYVLSPLYGFSSKDLAGLASLYYRHVFQKDQALRKLRLGLHSRKFHFSKNENLDYDLGYYRISPFVKFEFDKERSNQSRLDLKLQVDYTNTEKALFDPNGFAGKEWVEGFNKEAELHWRKSAAINPTSLKVRLNHMNYESTAENKEQYLKSSIEYIRSYQYAKSKFMRARVFLGAFLMHSEGDVTTGFVNNGNFGLTGESFFDYQYSDFYFNRSGGSDQYTNQIHERDGGFKVPLGSAYTFGQTNKAIGAVNLEMAIPKLPAYLPLFIYGDFAYLQNKALASEDFKWNFYYDAGVRIKISDVVAFNFPIVQTEAINSVLKERGNYLKRISFTFDFNAMTPPRILQQFNML
jgi:hypothetical protein